MVRLVLALLVAAPMTAGCQQAAAGCFAPGTTLPDRAEVMADTRLGQSGRDLALALLGGDMGEAERLLKQDGALAKLAVGPHHDMLAVSLARCDVAALDLLLRHGPPLDGVDGRGLPLVLALRADSPDLAYRLLKAGAKPLPPAAPIAALDTAIALNSPGGVTMLLDFHADPNVMERTGNRPLQSALDMEHFRIAELLLDRGADPWAIDSGGGNLASALATPMQTDAPAEAEARGRLQARLKRLGWPEPAPDPAAIRRLALDGAWPPAGAKGAAPVPAGVLQIMRDNAAAP